MKNQLVRVRKNKIHTASVEFSICTFNTKNYAFGSLFGWPALASLCINEIGTAICFSFGSKHVVVVFLILTRIELLSLIHSMAKHI